MDSGAALPPPADGASSPPGPPFDPQAPLLPEEVCWILDRAMACEVRRPPAAPSQENAKAPRVALPREGLLVEPLPPVPRADAQPSFPPPPRPPVPVAKMAYHTGLTLSQTVYTCLPLLPSSLPLLHPSALAEAPAFAGQTPAERARRPVELLALVLRAGVMGIAKSTGVVWDELMRGNLYDVRPSLPSPLLARPGLALGPRAPALGDASRTDERWRDDDRQGEDFMGDKSGLTLCDGDDPTEILAALEDAVDWLAETDLGASPPHRSCACSPLGRGIARVSEG